MTSPISSICLAEKQWLVLHAFNNLKQKKNNLKPFVENIKNKRVISKFNQEAILNNAFQNMWWKVLNMINSTWGFWNCLCCNTNTHMPNSLSKVEQTVQIPFRPKHQTHLLLSVSSSFVSGQSCLHFVVKEMANVN